MCFWWMQGGLPISGLIGDHTHLKVESGMNNGMGDLGYLITIGQANTFIKKGGEENEDYGKNY